MNEPRHYHYTHKESLPKIDLPHDKNASHGDHWAILTADITKDVPKWLQLMLENATLPIGLGDNSTKNSTLLINTLDDCHIKQVLALDDGKPSAFINAYPCVNSPYATVCQLQKAIRCQTTSDAILCLKTKDGTTIYAFDQLYAINHLSYQTMTDYDAHFSAWAYDIMPSDQDQSILVEDTEAIRHHRAFSDIVSANGGKVPDDIDDQIKAWQPDSEDLAPVEINLGHSCIYLYGETFGQEDEAWCQGQVLGISHTKFYDIDITLFDVAILREPDSPALMVRMATPTTDKTACIAVHDYIQANIWLQVAIRKATQG